MGDLILRFTASLPELTGDKWEVILLKEGPFVDEQFYITKEAIQAAAEQHLFDNVYIQELGFRDGTTRHLPRQLEQHAPGGVFHNAVAITANTTMKILDDGKAAIVGYVNAIDDNWKNKMRKVHELGQRLPGLSFNALIPKSALRDRLVQAGKYIKDVLSFGNTIDSVEIVSYPNAGGQFLRAVAEYVPDDATPESKVDESPSSEQSQEHNPKVIDRILSMYPKLQRYLQLRGIQFTDEMTPAECVQAALAADELDLAERNLLEVLSFSFEKEGHDSEKQRLVAALVDVAERVNAAKKPEKPEEPEEPEKQELEPEISSEKIPPVDTERLRASLQEDMQNALTGFMNSFRKKFKTELNEDQRLVAGREMIQNSQLPDDFKALALQQFNATKGDAKKILDAFSKAAAPLADTGRVRASIDPVYLGLTGRDKKEIAMLRMLGAVPNDKEKSDWQGVQPFRGIQDAFEICTGIPVHRLSPDEFNGSWDRAMRLTADIDMFMPTDFSSLLGSTMNRALMDLYGNMEHTWRELATKRSGVKDFRALRMNRLGGFDSPLSTYTDTATGVSTRYEGGIQLIGVPSEQEGTYNVQIYAGQFMLSYQFLVDDDINALKYFLKDFAAACDETALWLVCQRLINASSGVINAGTIYDSTALYTEAHGNLMSADLSYDNIRTAMSKIRKQRRLGGGRPLHLSPAILVAPESKRDVVDTLFETDKKPGGSDNDANTLRGKLRPIVIDEYWLGDLAASAKNWFVMTDPNRNAAIEIGFLFDREEPQILSQDGPTEGVMFTHLRTTFSAVHIMGAGVRSHECVVGSFPA